MGSVSALHQFEASGVCHSVTVSRCHRSLLGIHPLISAGKTRIWGAFGFAFLWSPLAQNAVNTSSFHPASWP